MISLREFKEQLFHLCLQQLEQKLLQLKQAMADTQEALASEAKSTAGDKHETGRAMIQLEQEKLGKQLREIQKARNALIQVPYRKKHQKVESGALVKTEQGLYFLAIGLGPIEVEGQNVFVVAPSSPVAQAMLLKEAGEMFSFNGHQNIIETIC